MHEFLANDNPQSFGDDYTEAIRSCLHLIEEKQDVASTEELSCLFDACISLLISGLINDREHLEDPDAKDPQVGKGILRSIQRFTMENIADSNLSTDKVAGYFGISARYLQKLFANDGTTFKTFVAGVRLKQVKADLLDPSIANSPAGDIALKWGFRDMTTFHRNFRRRFGETPGQMRSREGK